MTDDASKVHLQICPCFLNFASGMHGPHAYKQRLFGIKDPVKGCDSVYLEINFQSLKNHAFFPQNFVRTLTVGW